MQNNVDEFRVELNFWHVFSNQVRLPMLLTDKLKCTFKNQTVIPELILRARYMLNRTL